MHRGGRRAKLCRMVMSAATTITSTSAPALFGAVYEHGGHATLIRGEQATRASVDVFQPLDQTLRRLTCGLKEAFDPERILNPGRMYAGV